MKARLRVTIFMHIYGLSGWFHPESAQVYGVFLGNNHNKYGTLTEAFMGSQFVVAGIYERSSLREICGGKALWKQGNLTLHT